MSRLGDRLSRFFGRVEILARGAEPHLKAAEIALDKGDPLDARAQARALLARVPKSPLGLALWADAAEACGFPEEVVTALEQLAAQAPWQQEIWLRLGKAGLAAGWPGARAGGVPPGDEGWGTAPFAHAQRVRASGCGHDCAGGDAGQRTGRSRVRAAQRARGWGRDLRRE